MKALTIKEPWASLIIDKYKTYEFRSWHTKYRGKIYIHASTSIDKESLKQFNDYNISIKPGHIIGEAEITDCILVSDAFDQELRQKDKQVYGSDHLGYYAWQLKNIKKYENPIPAKGQLGLWNFEIETIKE